MFGFYLSCINVWEEKGQNHLSVTQSSHGYSHVSKMKNNIQNLTKLSQSDQTFTIWQNFHNLTKLSQSDKTFSLKKSNPGLICQSLIQHILSSILQQYWDHLNQRDLCRIILKANMSFWIDYLTIMSAMTPQSDVFSCITHLPNHLILNTDKKDFSWVPLRRVGVN